MELNPYAPPQVESSQGYSAFDQTGDGQPIAWRDGSLVVASRRLCRLPGICVKTGEPVSELTTFKLKWIAASLGMQLLVGALLAQMLWGQKHDFGIGLSPSAKGSRSMAAWIAGGVLLLAIVLAIVGLTAFDMRQETPLQIGLIVGGFFGALIALIALLITQQAPLRVKRSDELFVWLTGAKLPFLNQLPPWNPAWERQR